jgi:flavin reductase (DIM6/NTAB) family NADH-FMN oxidoreductase RutF
MSDDFHSYDPRRGSGLPHDPIASIVGPRPIGWIATRCGISGRNNLAPYSFFNVVNYKPPIVMFSSVGRKDTIRNIQSSGEFVVNLATRSLAEAMNHTSLELPHGDDEFALAGLTPRTSVRVQAAAVAESPVAMECRAIEVRQLRDLSGLALDTWMVLGEVLQVHIARNLLNADGSYDTAKARPILRGGGPTDYFEITPESRFSMRRPRVEPKAA